VSNESTDYAPVTMRETRRLWDECRERGILYNGMTHDILSLRYQGNLEHRMGKGWFKRRGIRPIPWARLFVQDDRSKHWRVAQIDRAEQS
jgi:hypothetical protein